jgi:hypothetical protein
VPLVPELDGNLEILVSWPSLSAPRREPSICTYVGN